MNSRKSAVNILNQWKKENKIIDFLIDSESKDINENDFKFVYFLVFGVIEKWLTLEAILKKKTNNKLKKNKLEVRIVMMAATYEILYSNQKEYAIINEYVNIVKKKSPFSGKIVNAVLRNIVSSKEAILKSIENSDDIEFKFNIPNDLYKLLKEYYSKSELLKWFVILNSEKNKIWVRKKIISEDKHLERFKAVDNLSDYLDQIKKGEYSVQDYSAGKVVEYMRPKKNSKILDFCSAPGSKSTYIAELTEDQAEIVSTDINSFRLEKVQESITRLNLKSIHIIEIEEVLKKKNTFDQILLDVPCTGSGTLFKNSDIKYRINHDKIEELNKIQMDIVKKVIPLLKMNGEIIYSTCSILPEENDQVIKKILESNRELKIIEKSKTILPFNGSYDGSYMVKLIKTKEL